MFVDVAEIEIKAGDGGNGAISFHRDKLTAFGGPDGGNGGCGGDIIFIGDSNLSTLADFRYKTKYFAENGRNGGSAKCSGKGGKNLVIKLPLGTLIINDKTKEILCDICDSEEFIAAKGGHGGAGNMNFANSVRRTPKYAKPGGLGEELKLRLELKLIADVGLIGFPNVGKSTLLSVLSEAKPKIANYHFTTLSPILGVVKYLDSSFVLADIPGLIEGASSGAGLGHEFLRHIHRCRVLIHILDVSGIEGRDPIKDFELINNELRNFSPKLLDYPSFVAANKCDIASEENIMRLKKYIDKHKLPFFPISAIAKTGLNELLSKVFEKLSQLPPVPKFKTEKSFIYRKNKNQFEVLKKDNYFVINSKWLEKVLEIINFDYLDSLQYFQSVLTENGVNKELKSAGASDGDIVKVGSYEFNFRNDF
ncbi:MAG: GTPase ObgE [Oscillospiraceae bacterium]|jgi:GTP-binding protein|nr:GTPase ObgE [Oscillospiraceae bacterium]